MGILVPVHGTLKNNLKHKNVLKHTSVDHAI